MSYQRCPICDGEGNNGMLGAEFAICDTCNGKKIIHTDTGLPPTSFDELQCDHEYVPVLSEEQGKMLCTKCGDTIYE